jgi:hypothetical protein
MFRLRNIISIQPGFYTEEQLLEELKKKVGEEINNLNGLQITLDPARHRVNITTAVKFALSCPMGRSLLEVLGFGHNTLKVSKTGPQMAPAEYMVVNVNRFPLEAKLSPSLPNIDHMYVYTDIASHSLLGDTQAPLLGVVPVPLNCKYGDLCEYRDYPINYVPVSQKVIPSITMKICTKTGEQVPFQEGEVICQLKFVRR